MTADEKCRADGQAKSATVFKEDLLQRMSDSPMENVWRPYFDTQTCLIVARNYQYVKKSDGP